MLTNIQIVKNSFYRKHNLKIILLQINNSLLREINSKNVSPVSRDKESEVGELIC